MLSRPKAIETRYSGCRFRSRTEARWAVFFDTLDIRWEYEPEGYELPAGRYLPDFWLPELDCFAEVKPMDLDREEFTKCLQLSWATGKRVLMLRGVPSNVSVASIVSPRDEKGFWQTEFECSYFHDKDLPWAARPAPYMVHTELYVWNCGPITAPPFPDDLNISAVFSYCGFWKGAQRGVEAAKSARFEFGEQG